MSCPNCKSPLTFFYKGIWQTYNKQGKLSGRIKRCGNCNFRLQGRSGEEDLIKAEPGQPEIKPEFNKWFVDEEPINRKVDIVFVETIKDEAKEAIEAVKENTEHPYKISVYNNTKEKGTNLSKMWNDMAKKSTCDYICYLNTDAFVSKGWLKEMMKGFRIKNVGVVGPSGDNIGGDQRKLYERSSALEHINEFSKLRSISGYCFVSPKRVLKEIPFPEDVEFYGGESLWCVDLYRKGYLNLWANGSWVSHQHSETVRKLDRLDYLREKGRKQVAAWEEKTAPILFLTYNRLDFTKKSLPALLNSGVQNIIIIDNNSTDGTKAWLKKQKSKKIKKIIFNKENVGIAGAMTQFFEITDGERFVGKVDNDTIVPKHWFRDLVYNCERHEISVMQAKHKILHPRFTSFEDWIEKESKVLEEGVYEVQHVGGSAVAIRRDRIDPNIIQYQGKSPLSGWTEAQVQSPLIKAFTDKVEIELLDMVSDNQYDWDKYPNYYREVGRNKEIYQGEVNVVSCFETIGAILERLGKKFAYTRFGDGELLMMKDFNGRPDTQYNSPKFKKELQRAFTIDNKDYLIAVSAGMKNENGMEKGLFARFDNDDELQNIVKKYYLYNKTFYNPIAFCYLLVFYPEMTKMLLQKLNQYKLGFIGGKHLRGISKFLKTKFIEIPTTQAFDTIDKWYPKVKKAIKGLDVVLISAGPTAQVLQRKLWDDTDTGTIDVGSWSSALTGEDTANHTWIKMSQDKIKKYYD
jgi:GT2 family glycosyltransferase